jgi:glycosyltransferase involved in cell wall biosynthesis
MWHTLKLWRQQGIDVTVIPTWGVGPDTRAALEKIGCEVVTTNADNIGNVPGLAGAVVHSMCNSQFWVVYGKLKEMRCRTVWSSCMTFEFPASMQAWRQHGLCDAYHFQSEFQKAELEKMLLPLGYNHGMGHLIHGAFAFDEVPFAPRPHKACEDFVVGRLARPDLDKWSSNHWQILGRVPYAGRKGLAMGWSPALDRKCGPKPSWAETLPAQKIAVAEFLGRCHAMLGLNGGARENWPRIGLEAMAAGVPIVAQGLWGWREMLIDGQTGFLTDSDEAMAFRLAQLAYNEDLRQTMILRARAHVRDLACPERISKQWTRLFAGLA